MGVREALHEGVLPVDSDPAELLSFLVLHCCGKLISLKFRFYQLLALAHGPIAAANKFRLGPENLDCVAVRSFNAGLLQSLQDTIASIA